MRTIQKSLPYFVVGFLNRKYHFSYHFHMLSIFVQSSVVEKLIFFLSYFFFFSAVMGKRNHVINLSELSRPSSFLQKFTLS